MCEPVAGGADAAVVGKALVRVTGEWFFYRGEMLPMYICAMGGGVARLAASRALTRAVIQLLVASRRLALRRVGAASSAAGPPAVVARGIGRPLALTPSSVAGIAALDVGVAVGRPAADAALDVGVAVGRPAADAAPAASAGFASGGIPIVLDGFVPLPRCLTEIVRHGAAALRAVGGALPQDVIHAQEDAICLLSPRRVVVLPGEDEA